MLKGRKAQAAMEFLMTYGWAILVVLIVIGALAYFGVLNPQRLLPSRCTFPTGISCKDYIVDSAGSKIDIEILNGLGRTIIITGANASGVAGNPFSCNKNVTGANITIRNGEAATVTIDDCTGTATRDPDVKWRWDLELIWYYEDSSVQYSKAYAGELFTSVD